MSRLLRSSPILLVELALLSCLHGFFTILLAPEPLPVPNWWLASLLFVASLFSDGWRPWVQVGVGAGVALGLCGLAGPLTGLAGLYLWWSGGLLPRLGLTQHPAVYHFTWRTVMLMLVAGLGAYGGQPIAIPLVLYFGAGLVALSQARWEQLAHWAGEGHSPQRVSVGLGALLIALGVVPALLFDPAWGRWFLGGAGTLFIRAVQWAWFSVLEPLLRGPLWLLQVLLAPLIRWIWSLAPEAAETPPEPLALDELLTEAAQAEQLTGLPNPISWLMRLLLVALAIIIMRRWVRALARRQPAQPAAERRESLFSWRQLGADLGLQRSWARQGALEADPSGMRAIYRRFLRWGRRQGLERQTFETPALYAQRFGDARVAAITDAYEKARYGTAPPSATEVEAARRALLELEQG